MINAVRTISIGTEYMQDCIGLHILAEYLHERDFRAKVFSGVASEVKRVIVKEITAKKVPVIGFYVSSDNLILTKNIIKWIKKEYPKIIIVLGGPQTETFDYDFFIETSADYAVIGEGEIPLFQLLLYLIDGAGEIDQIPSLSYIFAGKLVKNSIGNSYISDLDMIPFPKFYNSLNPMFRKRETIGLITGRGCPFHCSFCYEGKYSKNVRFRSLENVFREIDYIVKNNPKLEYINIYDDTFTVNTERLIYFCKEIKRRNLKWYCEGHVRFFKQHPEMLEVMKDAGLVGIQLGIESGSKEVLNAYNKQISPEDILDVVSMIKNAGINHVCGNLIIGGAKETERTLSETELFGKQLITVGRGIIELTTVYFSPYPNTAITTDPECYDMKICEDAHNSQIASMRKPVAKTKELELHDIWNAKKRLDKIFEKEYVNQALHITKKEMIQGLLHENHVLNNNRTWIKTYRSIDFLCEFMDHLDSDEQEYSKEKYPIRTFDDYIFEQGTLVSIAGSYYGTDALFLHYANGQYRCEEIAVELQLTDDQISNIYEHLNEKCLVYMSTF